MNTGEKEERASGRGCKRVSLMGDEDTDTAQQVQHGVRAQKFEHNHSYQSDESNIVVRIHLVASGNSRRRVVLTVRC